MKNWNKPVPQVNAKLGPLIILNRRQIFSFSDLTKPTGDEEEACKIVALKLTCLALKCSALHLNCFSVLLQQQLLHGFAHLNISRCFVLPSKEGARGFLIGSFSIRTASGPKCFLYIQPQHSPTFKNDSHAISHILSLLLWSSQNQAICCFISFNNWSMVIILQWLSFIHCLLHCYTFAVCICIIQLLGFILMSHSGYFSALKFSIEMF